MELTEKPYRHIASLLPKQRRNVKIDNRTLLNALIYRGEHSGKWRNLPQTFGYWQVISACLNRRVKKGVPDHVFKALAGEQLRLSGVCCLDSRMVKTHPYAHGTEKNGPQSIEKSRGGWNTKIHALTVEERGNGCLQVVRRKRLGCGGRMVAPGTHRKT
jgi:transposase